MTDAAILDWLNTNAIETRWTAGIGWQVIVEPDLVGIGVEIRDAMSDVIGKQRQRVREMMQAPKDNQP